MALLTLKDIGKIYVSEGNVAVGIRGVNLSFDRGEFVAVTGKSGSGKSTLLNVISGMDSYEEGELYIEGQTTSHYLQPEWEEYREKYISFIFQDYNIIESFTVLENVELALMHIEDKKERRARALELIKRVGLSSHIKHKGSRLSGGQKQRTVIARALAKDSPIILADEPTGNLDSATSKEIIELLREVSADKLLIVVTHNFEQVEACATRHIRIFDGAVESDHVITRPAATEKKEEKSVTERVKRAGNDRKRDLKNGITLGRSIFTAKPKLSTFLCLLMVVGTLGIFAVATLFGEAGELFEPKYMFSPIEGRMIITKQSGEVISDEELIALAEKYGAKDHLHYDLLLERNNSNSIMIPSNDNRRGYEYVSVNCTYGEDFGDNIIGRYPEANNEVFLYLPISYSDEMGKSSLMVEDVSMGHTNLKVTGVKYYYDNNKTPRCLFTEDGFRTVTAIHYLYNYADHSMRLRLAADKFGARSIEIYEFIPSFDMEEDKIYISSNAYDAFKKETDYNGIENVSASLEFSAVYYNYNYYYSSGQRALSFSKTFGEESFTDERPEVKSFAMMPPTEAVYISDELICEIAEEVLREAYRQASLFFENDKAAYAAVEGLRDDGYIAVPADTTYKPAAEEAILSVLASLALGFAMFLTIVFLAFFINLCSGRTLRAFKGEMAIMRSMGIGVKVIRIGMYVRMLLSLIPAFVLLAVTAVVVFTSPKLNEYFVFLYAWQYALIVIGMIALTVRITHKQIRKLFGESVRRSLKGGSAE